MTRATEGSVAPGGIAGRDFRLLLAATLATFANYAPLLSVGALWADAGGAGSAGAGSLTAVMMAGTVAAQLSMGVLLRLLSLRSMFVLGALLLGVPTLAYLPSQELWWLLAVSAVRGVGFGMVVVAGSALVAVLVPPAERGRAAGQYGVAVGLPAVLLLPLGVWLVEQVGFAPIFWTAALLAVAAVPLLRGMTDDRLLVASPTTPTDALASGRRWTPLLAPWVLLLAVACAYGGVVTFVPLTLPSSDVASVVLFVASAAMITGRWAAGVLSDRTGATTLLLMTGIATAALGMAGLGVALDLDSGAALLAVPAAAAYGVGFGAIQNETLVLMFQRAGPGAHGRASTVWNLAYDAGSGFGAYAIGVLALPLDMGGAFLVAALAIVLVLPAVRR
ncbi:MFS transporter [Nocardioides panacisoli]|uniref:MFS transporter n=1 Tax=Nocardioides panacisoli TaxID=627624 RepID=UPI001C63ACA9|nr:MFS transporter [Nocardioides panacisoli]QYJ05640.1 MFS transporter [Nocardioides panacisoli]